MAILITKLPNVSWIVVPSKKVRNLVDRITLFIGNVESVYLYLFERFSSFNTDSMWLCLGGRSMSHQVPNGIVCDYVDS